MTITGLQVERLILRSFTKIFNSMQNKLKIMAIEAEGEKLIYENTK